MSGNGKAAAAYGCVLHQFKRAPVHKVEHVYMYSALVLSQCIVSFKKHTQQAIACIVDVVACYFRLCTPQQVLEVTF